MAAEPLTLEALGVHLAAMAARITDAQRRSGRDDDECARIAGVTVDRWRAWCEARERPGVARVPLLAAAVDSTPPALLFGVDVPEPAVPVLSATDYARRAAETVASLAAHVDAVVQLAADVRTHRFPIAGGLAIGEALHEAADTMVEADAVCMLSPAPARPTVGDALRVTATFAGSRVADEGLPG